MPNPKNPLKTINPPNNQISPNSVLINTKHLGTIQTHQNHKTQNTTSHQNTQAQNQNQTSTKQQNTTKFKTLKTKIPHKTPIAPKFQLTQIKKPTTSRKTNNRPTHSKHNPKNIKLDKYTNQLN